MAQPGIKVKAFALIRRGDELLVGLGSDRVKGERFGRLLGGHVEFGETTRETIVREMREELAAEVVVDRLVGWVENLFEYEGEPGHEVVAIYEVRFADPTLLTRESFEFHDIDEGCEGVVWVTPQSMKAQGMQLYPEALTTLL
jgi:8-oxo-dGTP pyrophosphatase MutT (NUDIX family)